MAVELGYTSESRRIAALENEVDRLAGRQPRNKFFCTVCDGSGRIDISCHGSPEYEECGSCKGGKLVVEMNARLFGNRL